MRYKRKMVFSLFFKITTATRKKVTGFPGWWRKQHRHQLPEYYVTGLKNPHCIPSTATSGIWAWRQALPHPNKLTTAHYTSPMFPLPAERQVCLRVIKGKTHIQVYQPEIESSTSRLSALWPPTLPRMPVDSAQEKIVKAVASSACRRNEWRQKQAAS